ncbi:MAG: hypothetical protein AMXMBFR84_43390 [Candidatus Hydrogenedentota bacterium]
MYKAAADRFGRTRIGGLYPVKVAGYCVARLAAVKKVETNGYTLYLDPVDSQRIALRGEYEPFTTELVRRLLGPGDVAVDLGANIGYYTMLFSQIVERDGRVFAFEPDPDNFALLEKNIAINHAENVVAVRRAVSDLPGLVRLYKERFNFATHSLWASAHTRSHVDVEAIRMDDFAREHVEHLKRIRLIKMDIEGAEAHALRGMGAVLAANPGVAIISEFLPNVLRNLGTEPIEYLMMLQSLGFAVYDIDQKQQKLIQKPFAALCDDYDRTLTDLLCLRSPVPAIASYIR